MARPLLLPVPSDTFQLDAPTPGVERFVGKQAPGNTELPLGKVATSLAIGLVLGGLTCCGLMTLQDRVTPSAPAQPHGVVKP